MADAAERVRFADTALTFLAVVQAGGLAADGQIAALLDGRDADELRQIVATGAALGAGWIIRWIRAEAPDVPADVLAPQMVMFFQDKFRHTLAVGGDCPCEHCAAIEVASGGGSDG